MPKEPLQTFRQLEAWKEAHVLVLMIYRLTKQFPAEERFGLTDQIRRAVVSIVSNIAEGFSRTSYREKAQFYSTALGSLSEVQSQLLVAKDLKFTTEKIFVLGWDQSIQVSKLLHGLVKSTKARARS